MVYDPIAKKAYDKERNAKIKNEYLASNPNYKPTRQQQKERNEERKIKYLNNQQNTTQQPHQQPLFFQTLAQQTTQPTQQITKPKPKYNPNSIEAKKSKDFYADDDDDESINTSTFINIPKVKFY
jgi:hypothetical protein